MMQRKRIVSLAMIFSLLAGLALPVGAAEAVVFIHSEEDWEQFVEQCVQDVWSQGLTVHLTADLNLTGREWKPVPIFQGTFHGGGHKITGLHFEKEGSQIGLFRTLTQSAVVENLIVEGEIIAQGTAQSVGLLAGENYGTVEGCASFGTVSGQACVGGLIGQNQEEGQILDCVSGATVLATVSAGGIAGSNLGYIEGCRNEGNIDTQADQAAPSNVGGVAGLCRGTILECENSGTVGYSHVGYNVGGIVGLLSGEVTNCRNTGSIRGRKDVGGITGQFEPTTSVRYGTSPTQDLSQSLGSLLTQLQDLTNTLDTMAGQGIAGVQTIQEALQVIGQQTGDTAELGLEDFQTMADALYQNTTSMQAALDALRQSLSQFQSTGAQQLKSALEDTENLLQGVWELGAWVELGVQDSVEALEKTLEEIRRQLQTVSAEYQAMGQELEELETYVAQVAELVADGEFQQALELPMPALNLPEHFRNIKEALGKLPQLSAELIRQWSQIDRAVGQGLEDTSQQLEEDLADLQDAFDALLTAGDQFVLEAGSSLDQVSQSSKAVQELLREYAQNLGNRAQETVDVMDTQLAIVQDQVTEMTQGAESHRQALYGTTQQMIRQLEDVRQAIEGLGEEPELIVQDLSDSVEEGPGLILGCTVQASIEGDSNVGGLVGTVAPELGDDPEATFQLDDLELAADVYATLRAVVRDSRFDGQVTVKNECGGGIAGRCEAGAILNCIARGQITTGWDYCGGIAGRTKGRVLQCAALTELSGQSWLGGIAGLGKDIGECRAMVQATGEGEYRGAIAGQAEGTLEDNVYLREELAGLDGVEYFGKAQGAEFSEFSQLSYVPQDFLQFSYQFVVGEQVVAEIPFAYGEDLDVSQVPSAPERNGQYGQWPSFSVQNLRRSAVIEAEFSDPVTVLADQEGVARLLVQGDFGPDGSLNVQEISIPEPEFGKEAVAAWEYEVTGNQEEKLVFRLRAQEASRPAVALLHNGKWEILQSTQDGNYLVFTGPAEGQLVLLDQAGTYIWRWIMAGAVILLMVVAAGRFWMARKKKAVSSTETAQAD